MSMGYYHKDDLLETTQILPIISLFLKVWGELPVPSELHRDNPCVCV